MLQTRGMLRRIEWANNFSALSHGGRVAEIFSTASIPATAQDGARTTPRIDNDSAPIARGTTQARNAETVHGDSRLPGGQCPRLCSSCWHREPESRKKNPRCERKVRVVPASRKDRSRKRI